MHKAMCVKWVRTFGFLQVRNYESSDVFVHYEEIDLDWYFRKLHEGEEVLVEIIEETPKGPQARGVRLVGLAEYKEAKEALEKVLADVKQSIETKNWASIAELARTLRQTRETHYRTYMFLHEKRRTEIWLRIPYSNLRDDSWEVLASCEGTREGHITLAQAVKVTNRALEITKGGKGNAHAFRIHRGQLLKLRNAGVMINEINSVLEAMLTEVARQIEKGRNRRETKRLRDLADDLANDLVLTD